MVILVPYFMSLNASYKRLIYEGSSTLYIEEASKSTINVAFSLFFIEPNILYYEICWRKRNASGAKKREEIFEWCHVEK